MQRKPKAINDTSPLGQMRSLIEELTHSGQKELSGNLMSSLRNICKLSDDYVRRGYQMVMHQLQKDHAEVRYSAFLIIDEFFRRSHTFRELLLADMQEYMELTIEVNKNKPLPPPKVTAEDLKKKALQALNEWNQKYGGTYKKLSLAHKFLKNCYKVDFRELEIQSSVEHQRRLELERKKQEFLEAKSKKILKEIEESEADIRQALTSMENCLSLLLPHPKDFFLNADDGNNSLPLYPEARESSTSKELKCYEEENTKDGVKEARNIFKNISHNTLDDSKDIVKEAAIKSDVHSEEEPHVPESDSSQLSSSDSEKEPEESFNLREYGVLNYQSSITIDLKPKPENFKLTEENFVIAENARDLYIILSTRHLIDVKKWIQILTKSDPSNKLKSLLDLRQSIAAVVNKYNELNLPSKKFIPGESDDSDDSDFEEVKPKEDFEEKAIEPLPSTSKGIGHKKTINEPTLKDCPKADWSIISQENYIQDPTTSLATYSKTLKEKIEKDKSNPEGETGIHIHIEDSKNSGIKSSEPSVSVASTANKSRKSKLLAVAPKVPFDLDLYHWENEQVPSSVMMTSHPDVHNFWSSSTADAEENEVPKELHGTTRVIEFSGKFDPVKRTCRAPLPSGKLCPRRDRVKCPFHGPVVPRDEMGNICEVDGKLPDLPPEQPKVPDWQDPELLREIKSQTGIDLTMPEKGKRGKKQPKYPGLTDVKAAQNTAYNRLAKKIFKKSTVKRVASTLDAIDHKRFRDKFGDQFNYS